MTEMVKRAGLDVFTLECLPFEAQWKFCGERLSLQCAPRDIHAVLIVFVHLNYVKIEV